MSSYTLAIDFGTTWTAAAVHTDSTVARLDFAGETRLPSLIWIDDEGNPLVGQEALHQWAMAPERLLAEPKAHLGQLESILVGGDHHQVSELVGAVLARVVREARERYGDDPAEVRLTHPARWGDRRKRALVEAAQSAGISSPTLISEPEAAALWLANKLEEGQRLAVYDLGGGTFDTAVLERTAEGFVVRGEPGGDEHLGGERFDDRLLGHVGEQIAPDHPEAWKHLQKRDSSGWAKRAADLRADVRLAKESLSHAESSYISVPVGLEEQPLLIKRGELEELIGGDVRRSYDLLDETIGRAELEPGDLEGIYLTGGSSQLRLVRDLGQQRYANLQIRDDPKSVVALGAAGAHRLAEDEPVVETEPATPEVTPPIPPPPPVDTTQPRRPSKPPPAGQQPAWSFPVWQLVAAVGAVIGTVVVFTEHEFSASKLLGVSSLALYAGVLATAALSAARRDVRFGIAMSLLAAGMFGWTALTANPLAINSVGGSMTRGAWFAFASGILGAAAAIGMSLSTAQIRDWTWRRPGGRITVGLAAAGLAGLLLIGTFALPNYGGSNGYEHFTGWEAAEGWFDYYRPVLAVSILLIVAWAAMSSRPGLPWLAALLGVVVLFLVYAPYDFKIYRHVGLPVGYWLGLLGAVLAAVGGIAAWLQATRPSPKGT